MTDIVQKPKGQTIMIILGICSNLYSLIIYLTYITLILFTDIQVFETFGPVYQFIFLTFFPFTLAYYFLILFKLFKKDVEAIYMIRILIPFSLFIGTLSIVEGLYLRIWEQVFGLISVPIALAVLFYWNRPVHIKYFRSLKN